MDDFRKKQQSVCAVGGLHCHCCNPFKGNRKPHDQRKLNHIARARLKASDQKNHEI